MRKSDIEGRLRDHYAHVRLEKAPDPAAKARTVALVAAEAGREAPAATAPQAGFARFVLGQARYVRAWVWAAQAGLLALLACGSVLVPTDEAASACTAVVGGAHGARRHARRAAQPREQRGRARVRLPLRLAPGAGGAAGSCSGCRTWWCSRSPCWRCPALARNRPAALCSCMPAPPFFLTAAGSLRIATRAREGVTARCLVFGTLVATLAVMAWQAAPRLYAASAAGLWAVLVRARPCRAALETKAYLSSVAAGLDCLGAPAQP